MSDDFGGKRVGIGMLLFLFIPLTIGSQAGSDLSSLLAIGLILGTAGASLAVAVPLASRWYPPERQGLVVGMACFGLGNGSVFQLVPQWFHSRSASPRVLLARWEGWAASRSLSSSETSKNPPARSRFGFDILSVLALSSFIMLRALVLFQSNWRLSWQRPAPMVALDQA